MADVRAFQRVQETTEALRQQVSVLKQVREETEGIVGLQERGVQQARDVARASREIAAAVGRSTGGGGGGGFLSGGNAGVLGLLVAAMSSGGGGHGGPGPGFQPGAPSLRGGSFARSAALGQFR